MASENAVEGTFKTTDGQELYTKTWNTPSDPVARLVFIHGFSDHCNFYDTLFPPLAAKGIKVYSFDQRGWGRSVHKPSQKGLTGPTTLVLEDITDFIRNLPTSESSIPLFLGGHSMGGAEVLTYAAEGPSDVMSTIRGFVCESPFVALHPKSAPLKLTVVLGRIAGRLLPHMQMVQKLDPKTVCRDPAIITRYDNDPLCHDTGTLEGLAGMLDRAANLDEGKVVVAEGRGEGGKTRLWVGHGTSDLICYYDAAKRLMERSKVQDKEFKSYDGWYHKLHTEPGEDKVIFANDVAGWILDRTGPIESLTTKSKL